MALTPQDLHQIGLLLDEKLEAKLEQKLNEKLAPIHEQLQSHQAELISQKKELRGHSKLLKKVKSDQNIILEFLDREQVDIKRRLLAVEERLNIN